MLGGRKAFVCRVWLLEAILKVIKVLILITLFEVVKIIAEGIIVTAVLFAIAFSIGNR